ncbi:MAG: hypothetical protein AAEJ53_18210 [Myxococcota bacterium]
MREFEILDPSGGEYAPAWELNAALDADRAYRIGLLDINKRQGDLFLDEIESLLVERGHAVFRYRKPTMTRPATATLVGEIAEACDAALVALAD